VAQPPMTLAEKVTWLFENVLREDGSQHSRSEVARAIAQYTGGSCTRNYVAMLASGQRDNPTMDVIEGLADFFDINRAYFVDDEKAREIQDQLNMAVMLRDDRVRAIALRAVTSALVTGTRTGALSVEALTEVHELIMRRTGNAGDQPNDAAGQGAEPDGQPPQDQAGDQIPATSVVRNGRGRPR
jgi:hypothetical protein